MLANGPARTLSSSMKSFVHAINRSITRWTCHLEKVTGLRVEPHSLIACAATVVILLQFTIYLALSTQAVYCRLPSLRPYYLKQAEPLYEKLPTIYVITPTYSRHVQKAELTRLSQTLMLVPRVHWIIVEDSQGPTRVVTQLVNRLSSEYEFSSITQLHRATPSEFKLKPGDPSWKYPKGVWQRNEALAWIRGHASELDPGGVVYFADDDNTYDLGVFGEMRFTKRVSVWPVGLAGGLLVERPLVRRDHNDVERVIKFNSMWEPKRPFPIDMAGFAVSLQLILEHPNSSFSDSESVGYIESHFLGQFVSSWSELEPKASSCKRVLVWHTRTRDPALHEEKKLKLPSTDGLDL